jgi:hypothetical protein
MIVWGGYSFGLLEDTGGRYDPDQDTWMPTSTSGAPRAMERHTAVWTGSTDQRMIVWGGDTGGLYCAAPCSAPGASDSLGFLADGDTLAWPPQPGAATYDVVKGDLVLLRSGAGDFAGSVSSCLMNDGTDTQVEDTETPSAGQGFYYLFRSIGCEALVGTYDSGGIGQQGGRDAGIAGSGNACP